MRFQEKNMFGCSRSSWLIKENTGRILDLVFGLKEIIRDFIIKKHFGYANWQEVSLREKPQCKELQAVVVNVELKRKRTKEMKRRIFFKWGKRKD